MFHINLWNLKVASKFFLARSYDQPLKFDTVFWNLLLFLRISFIKPPWNKKRYAHNNLVNDESVLLEEGKIYIKSTRK